MNSEIIKSKDYSLFNHYSINRDVTHHKLLRESMIKHGFLAIRPIVCDKKFKIIDGQHRLEIARELGIEFYYCIHDVKNINQILADVQIAKAWKNEDYLKMYVTMGYDEYLKVKDINLKYPKIRLALLLDIIDGFSHGTREKFRNGTFKIKNLKSIDFAITCALDIRDKYSKKKFLLSHKFLHSFTKIAQHRNYNHERFLNKMVFLNGRLIQCVNTTDYDKIIQEIYNYKQKVDIVDFGR